MNVPDDLRYSHDHEWVRVDGAIATVGITDYAQDALGDVVYVELPELSLAVSAGETFSEVESTKSVSDIVAPISGSVVEVNDALDANPELINSDPYGEGWICRFNVDEAAALEGLMDAAAYRALTESEG